MKSRPAATGERHRTETEATHEVAVRGAAASMSVGARPALNDHVRVTWAALDEDFEGQVVDTMEQLGNRSKTAVYSYQVSYTDGDRRWHTWNADNSPPVEVLPTPLVIDDDVVAESWEQHDLRCAVSFQRLEDPARLSECRHRACCNYDALQECGRRGAKACPVAGCDAKYGRRHALCRDTELKARLATVPPSVTSVWLRGSELRIEKPMDSTTAEASQDMAPSNGHKRSRGGPVPKEKRIVRLASGRHSTRRHGVIALDCEL